MSSPYDRPPDEKEMERVVLAIVKAWKEGSDYIAESRDLYFRYAVPLLDMHGAERISPGKTRRTADGREFMMDTYRAPSGNIIQMGYEITAE